jgi:hypothetical protein
MMNKDFKYNIFAFVLILVVLYFGLTNLQKEGFVVQWNAPPSKDKIHFNTAKQTAKFIMDDPDNYMHHFNGWDLIARHVSTEIDYRRNAAMSSLDFTECQKDRITKAAHKADEFFAAYRSDYAQTNEYIQISGKDIVAIPWVFSLTKGDTYENGMPHTRANIIFLSSNQDETLHKLTRILVHEKIHLYQRLYPKQCVAYLNTKGFIQWKLRQGVPRIRSNPDLDPWIYIDTKTDKPLIALYASDKPRNISDTVNPFNDIAYEHPYELMAYTIEKCVK